MSIQKPQCGLLQAKYLEARGPAHFVFNGVKTSTIQPLWCRKIWPQLRMGAFVLGGFGEKARMLQMANEDWNAFWEIEYGFAMNCHHGDKRRELPK